MIMTGGIEENGPYLTTGKHNNVLRVMGESDRARAGQRAVAPIVTLEPGQSASASEHRRAPCSCRRRPTAPCSPTWR